MAGRPIPVRLETELIQALDAFAQRLGMKRSNAIRLILRRALFDDAIKAVISEEVITIRARILEELGRVESRVRSDLAARARGDLPGEVPALPSRGEDVIEAELGDGRKRKRRR